MINESPGRDDRHATFNILFPSPTSNGGSARLGDGQEMLIPERGEGFQFDAEDGIEKLWLVWSSARIDDLDALKRWANPQDMGEIKDAREVDAVRAFLAARVSPAPDVQESPDGKPHIHPRRRAEICS